MDPEGRAGCPLLRLRSTAAVERKMANERAALDAAQGGK